MIIFTFILVLCALNHSVKCLKSSDFCIKTDFKFKCSGKQSYSCGNELCASGKRICQIFNSIKYIATMNNLYY